MWKRRRKGCRSGGSDCNRREAWSNRLGPKPFPRLLREIPNSRSLKHLIAVRPSPPTRKHAKFLPEGFVLSRREQTSCLCKARPHRNGSNWPRASSSLPPSGLAKFCFGTAKRTGVAHVGACTDPTGSTSGSRLTLTNTALATSRASQIRPQPQP